MRIILALIVLLATAPALAQQPLNAPTDQADKQKSDADKRGTEQVPFIVKELPRERSAEDTKQDNEKTELDRKVAGYTADLATYTWLLFIATVVLGVFTGALFGMAVYQIREGRKSTRAAEDAAKAASASAKSTDDLAKHMERQAKIAESTARHVERPYAFLEIENASEVQYNPLVAPSEINKSIEIRYKIINHGRTPAIVYQRLFTEDYIRFDHEKPGLPSLPPALPNYAPGIPEYILEILSPRRETQPEPHRFRPRGGNPEDGAIPVVFGYLRYRDVAGRHYQSGFGYTWTEGRLRPSNDEYNYDRRYRPQSQNRQPHPYSALMARTVS